MVIKTRSLLVWEGKYVWKWSVPQYYMYECVYVCVNSQGCVCIHVWTAVESGEWTAYLTSKWAGLLQPASQQPNLFTTMLQL